MLINSDFSILGITKLGDQRKLELAICKFNSCDNGPIPNEPNKKRKICNEEECGEPEEKDKASKKP